MAVNEYALQFRTLAASSGWNEQALITSYRQGLDPRVRLHLAAYKDSIGLEGFIQLSIRANLSRRKVSRCVGPFQLGVGILHVEEIHLLVLEESTSDMSPRANDISICTTSIESPVEKRSVDIPSCYTPSPKSLSWTQEATNAFEALKKAFTTAPLLVHPNPDLPFVIEVDASTTGVGAVLSQQQGTPSRLHPCAFFSRKLNPAEVNYDIGDRELLAVKVALEEWRHWLEGAKHSFLVLTDHKNLEYLRAAKRLNPCQACWAMFFSRFDFSISYHPGSKNIKADALSHLHAPDEKNEEPETILPESIFVSPISWSEETLPSSNASTNAPPGCPQGLQYITRTRCTPLVHSAHTSLGTGHPGVNETLSLLKERFW
ncbi:uncharacterized protein LOC125275953 [Megalobrama amblycephala]|uniref:uncharacterized protein LOC125275953 n=1 Tax=Megalobrama amblycephala TaxID=75352 RepID=UPI0020140F11|nr:uncharacterized protein LOC125275953 [Megalobrama amblycephala]